MTTHDAQSASASEHEQLSGPEARARTNELKKDLEALAGDLRMLKDRGAHIALGYSTWREYVETEFGISVRKSYYLLNGRPAPTPPALSERFVDLDAELSAELSDENLAALLSDEDDDDDEPVDGEWVPGAVDEVQDSGYLAPLMTEEHGLERMETETGIADVLNGITTDPNAHLRRPRTPARATPQPEVTEVLTPATDAQVRQHLQAELDELLNRINAAGFRIDWNEDGTQLMVVQPGHELAA